MRSSRWKKSFVIGATVGIIGSFVSWYCGWRLDNEIIVKEICKTGLIFNIFHPIIIIHQSILFLFFIVFSIVTLGFFLTLLEPFPGSVQNGLLSMVSFGSFGIIVNWLWNILKKFINIKPH